MMPIDGDTPRDSTSGKMRIAVLTEIISPYRIPFLNELSSDPSIDLEVLFFSKTEGRRNWKIPWKSISFKYQVLPGWLVARRYQGGPIFFNPGVWRNLQKGRFQAVIFFGYHHPTIWLSLLWCRIAHIRTLVWSESTLLDIRSSNKAVEKLKRWIVARCDGFIAAGSSQVKYLRHLGASHEQIWVAPDSVDSEHFTSQSLHHRSLRPEIMRALGIKPPIVLYVGRLLDAKGIPELLDAFKEVIKHQKATLLLVGDGPDRMRYEKICTESNLASVHFVGFQDQEELPRYYGIADVLVFPTRSDPWGLVLNEGMCSGLPILCSTAAGAALDLVFSGQNGFLHEPGDVQQLAKHLKTLLRDPNLRSRMGQCSQEIIAGFTPQRMAHGFLDAIRDKPQDSLS